MEVCPGFGLPPRLLPFTLLHTILFLTLFSYYVYHLYMKRFIMALAIQKYERLRTISKQEGVNITELVRRIIDTFLEKRT